MKIIDFDMDRILEKLDKRHVTFEDQSILVTGGAGFIGSWICDILIRQNAKVICIDNFSSGLKDNIRNLLGNKKFTLIEHDISKPIFFDEDIDLVLHLASRASPFEFKEFPIQILKANTLGTWVALGIAKKCHAQILYASSSEVYGNPDPKHVPTQEAYYGNVNPIGPRSCYDEAKRVGEAFVTAYHIQHGLHTKILRIFNTYGPRIRAKGIYGRVVSRFIEQALNQKPITIFGDGTQTRSFTYVTDLVEGMLLAAHELNIEGQVLNIGNNEEMRIIDLAQTILNLTNSQSKIDYQPLPADDPKRRCPDLKKIENLLSWKPTTSVEEGLEKTIAWFRCLEEAV